MGKAMMEWIKCSERLPHDIGSMFFYLMTDGKYIGLGWYEPSFESDEDCSENRFKRDLWYEEGRFPWFDVTHWMPLPDLPKELNGS